MVPTIPHSYRFIHPHILVSKLHRRGRNLSVGDVVTYTNPMMPNSTGCKRIIGLPGDIIHVLSPGKRDEDMENENIVGGEIRDELFVVPEGHCWLEGDNLEWSRDSRVFGPVPLALVKGKVLALLWPWREAKWFRSGLVDAKEGEHEWVATH